MKSLFDSRIMVPSVSMVTVALRLPSEISASSPKLSPGPSSASWIGCGFVCVVRVTMQRPSLIR